MPWLSFSKLLNVTAFSGSGSQKTSRGSRLHAHTHTQCRRERLTGDVNATSESNVDDNRVFCTVHIFIFGRIFHADDTTYYYYFLHDNNDGCLYTNDARSDMREPYSFTVSLDIVVVAIVAIVIFFFAIIDYFFFALPPSNTVQTVLCALSRPSASASLKKMYTSLLLYVCSR